MKIILCLFKKEIKFKTKQLNSVLFTSITLASTSKAMAICNVDNHDLSYYLQGVVNVFNLESVKQRK